MIKVGKATRIYGTMLLAAVSVFVTAGSANAGEGYGATFVEKAPPSEISAEIRAELGGKAVQITGPEGLRYEFWFAKSIALSAATEGGKALEKIPPITLLGAAQVSDVENLDFREDEVLPGVYTMRYGLQPEDGNHLGTSEHPFFAILIPAERDQKLAGIEDHDDMVDRSMEDTAGVHPYILAMQPLPADAPDTVPAVSEGEYDWMYVVLELAGKVEGSGEDVPFKFALVFEGIGDL